MANSYPIETIPAAAISEIIGGTPAVVIETDGNNSIIESLKRLNAHSEYTLYHTNPGIGQLAQTLQRTAESGIKTIVLCGKRPPIIKSLISSAISAALISPGSEDSSPWGMPYQAISQPTFEEFAHLGYQTYRYHKETLSLLRSSYFQELRLGVLRSDISLAEPLLRTKEYIFIDLNSVRHSDFPDNKFSSPNGLYAEELCQLARYIGMGQSIKSIFIYGYPSDLKADSVSAALTAELIWHIVEAISSNIIEDPSNAANDDLFLRKIVSMGQEGQDLVFVTSSSTGRWWMEVPRLKEGDFLYFPCSNSDYLTACSGEVPLRWLFFFQKINPN